MKIKKKVTLLFPDYEDLEFALRTMKEVGIKEEEWVIDAYLPSDPNVHSITLKASKEETMFLLGLTKGMGWLLLKGE